MRLKPDVLRREEPLSFQDLGGIGEFVGGVGVIVSLIYLALQIRQNSRIERLNARYAVHQSMQHVMDRLDDDPELQRIWLAALAGGETAEGDRERLGRFLFRYFSQMSLAYTFAEVEPDIRERYTPLLLRFLEAPAVQGWWSRQRLLIAEPFRLEVDAHLRSIARG
ncbi:MAG: hypothetical protein GY937_05630 [bacterium]|nr:hypothetical protein [bacterium]